MSGNYSYASGRPSPEGRNLERRFQQSAIDDDSARCRAAAREYFRPLETTGQRVGRRSAASEHQLWAVWNETSLRSFGPAVLSGSKELRMNKTILVGLAILLVSTSAASAWTHQSRAHPNASAA